MLRPSRIQPRKTRDFEAPCFSSTIIIFIQKRCQLGHPLQDMGGLWAPPDGEALAKLTENRAKGQTKAD